MVQNFKIALKKPVFAEGFRNILLFEVALEKAVFHSFSFLDAFRDLPGSQSWTALFRAFSSHRQPSAIFSKVFPAEQTSWPNWQTLLACTEADG